MKLFLISMAFVMNMDKFLISFLFSVIINSINSGIFNIFQYYGLILLLLLFHYSKAIQIKHELHLPKE